ncbi:MAG: hypothetical protein ACR2NM_06645 [Bythopirellula sp.]
MMKYQLLTTGTLLSVIAASIMMSLPVRAAIDNPANSSGFTFKYEGDAPTTNGDPASGFGNTGYAGGTTGYTLSSDGNILDVAIETGHANPGLSVYLQSPDWVANATHSAGWTLESNFKLNTGRFTMRIGDENDPHDIIDVLSTDGRVVSRIAGTLTTIPDITNDFHTYRIAQSPNSDEYNFWVDHNLVAEYAGADTGIGTGGNHWWSDGSGSTSGEYEMDYMRFTADGFSPDVIIPPDISIVWNVNNSGDWNLVNNWTGLGAPPVTPNQSAVFGDAIQSTQVVFTITDVSVNDVQFDNANSYIVSGGGTIQLIAGTVAGLPPSGFSVAQGAHEFQAPVSLNNNATANIASSSTLTFNNALNLNSHTLTKSGDGTLTINNVLNAGGGAIVGLGGTIAGSGVVGGSLSNQSAMVSPGNSPGTLTVEGNYTQCAGAILAIEVAGTGPGVGHDQLDVHGSATLDGTLDITTAPGYTPGVGATPGVVGDSFIILTADSRTGTFSSVNGRHAGGGRFFDVTYNAANVTLGAFQAAVGDADGDKDVDITDFNTLSGNFDPNGEAGPHDWTDADFDLDGDVDITDFNGLSQNFAPNGYAGNGGQVPEPAGIVTLVIGFLTLIGIIRRRPARPLDP